MARDKKEIKTNEVESVPTPKGGFWRYFWFPTALLLALSAAHDFL